MTSGPKPNDVKVIADFFDSNDVAACGRLQAWMAEDTDRVAMFVDHMLLHNDLGRLALADDLARYDLQDRERSRSVRAASASSAMDSPSTRSPLLRYAAIAASLLLAIGSWQYFILTNSQPTGASPTGEVASADRTGGIRPADNKVVSDEIPAFVATVSDTENCIWKNSDTQLQHGQYLATGTEVALESGLAQLTFETGAVVILEGPCHLIVDDNSVELLLGKLSATVPRAASGFSVDTPNSEVVDLGTEFGINVGADGDTEVHVFKGEVISRRIDDLGEPISQFVRLTTNRAIAFREGTKEAEEFEANEAAFSRILREVAPSGPGAIAPVEGALKIWLAADQGVLRDEAGGVLAWLDTLTPSFNRIADNALQSDEVCRPAFVPDAINGKPAIYFDGKDDCLTTTPMSTGDNQTIAFVSVFEQRDGGDASNLISYNGPPQILGAEAERGKVSILQIRASGDPVSNGMPLLDPYVYAGHWRGESLFVGRMERESRDSFQESQSPKLGEPFVAVYVYDMAGNRAELFVNGRSYGNSTAPVSASITSRKVIGRHGHWPDYFRGQIAELLIYDEGLDAERIGRLSSRLAEKYSIQID